MTDDQLLSDAEALVEYLRMTRSLLKRAEGTDLLPDGLTVPQVTVLRELIVNDGLSLKDLSARLNLAHSTVSGMVDRLERQELVHRRPDPEDKRISRVYLDPKVPDYVNNTFYSRWSQILAEAIAAIPPIERIEIVNGFARVHDALREFLEKPIEPEPPDKQA